MKLEDLSIADLYAVLKILSVKIDMCYEMDKMSPSEDVAIIQQRETRRNDLEIKLGEAKLVLDHKIEQLWK